MTQIEVVREIRNQTGCTLQQAKLCSDRLAALGLVKFDQFGTQPAAPVPTDLEKAIAALTEAVNANTQALKPPRGMLRRP